jgi:hypothetical protein
MEHPDFRAADVFHHGAINLDTGNRRRADLHFAVVSQEKHFFELEGFIGFDGQTIDFEDGTFHRAVLFTAALNDSVLHPILLLEPASTPIKARAPGEGIHNHAPAFRFRGKEEYYTNPVVDVNGASAGEQKWPFSRRNASGEPIRLASVSRMGAGQANVFQSGEN